MKKLLSLILGYRAVGGICPARWKMIFLATEADSPLLEEEEVEEEEEEEAEEEEEDMGW